MVTGASRPRSADGAGGLVSTADDLLAFARMLLGGGKPVLPPAAVAEMTRDQLTPAQKAHGGLGPDFFDEVSWGFCTSVVTAGPRAGAFGWAGGFGTTWLADPARDLTVIVLTQRTFEGPAAARRARANCRRGLTPRPDPPAGLHSGGSPSLSPEECWPMVNGCPPPGHPGDRPPLTCLRPAPDAPRIDRAQEPAGDRLTPAAQTADTICVRAWPPGRRARLTIRPGDYDGTPPSPPLCCTGRPSGRACLATRLASQSTVCTSLRATHPGTA